MRIATGAPLIGVPACLKESEGLPFHSAGDKYVAAVAAGAGGLPMLVPALGDAYDMDDLLGRLDGLLITGSRSNVAPHHYNGPPDRPESPQDPARDATTLPLIRAALAAGVPLLCICRGIQELNVALGGTLHQQVHLLPGKIDHRSPQGVPYDAKYAPRHEVALDPGGQFARIVGARKIQVNSLHWQGIDRPAADLIVEGTAPDGMIEAVSVRGAKGFVFGVQWHPEYRIEENPVSMAIFQAFGAAARAFGAKRRAVRAA